MATITFAVEDREHPYGTLKFAFVDLDQTAPDAGTWTISTSNDQRTIERFLTARDHAASLRRLAP
jgi:hypothetical protein